jgi:hypothetical protein
MKTNKLLFKTAYRYCLLLLFAATFAACSKDNYPQDSDADVSTSTTPDPPPYAASNIIWLTVERTWSDVIQIPECNKETFEESHTIPQCRSYTRDEDLKTWYYYNWPFVNAYVAHLCPDPWRVPDVDDFAALWSDTSDDALNALQLAWGDGGYANYTDDATKYWSITLYPDGSPEAYCMYFSHTGSFLGFDDIDAGYQVRCVK